MDDPVPRSPIDRPESLVRQAMATTGARTERPLVIQAVQDLVNRESQLATIDRVERGGLPGITYPEVRADARR